jgi:hypothetical protein
MADKGNQNEPRAEVRPSEILEQIVRNPAQPEVRRLTGFLLGRSDRDDYWRLYLTVDLNHYLEIRKEDTLHAQEFRPGRTVVWINPDAKIAETNSATAPIDFLKGDIQRGFLRGVSGMQQQFLAAADCPGSGCAHCSVACSNLPGGDTVGYTCGC